jgi:hypothetical protein
VLRTVHSMDSYYTKSSRSCRVTMRSEFWTGYKKGQRDDVASAYVLHPLQLLIVSICEGVDKRLKTEGEILETRR